MCPRFPAILALSLVLALLRLGPAWADCNQACLNSCRVTTPGSTYWACVMSCGRNNCKKPTVSYGSIAYGAQSRAYGFSNQFADTAKADQFALGKCAQHGDDCKIVASFLNKCAAVAAPDGGDAFVTAEAPSGEAAQSKALQDCEAKGKGSCAIQVWSCALP